MKQMKFFLVALMAVVMGAMQIVNGVSPSTISA